MSKLAHLPIRSTPERYLGPAEVAGDDTTRLLVDLPSGDRVAARIALGYGYRPALGDSVLVIGDEAGHWIIGVLVAQHAAKLSFSGDVDICAGGRLALRGEDGVTIEGPEVSVRAGKLEMLARKMSQRFDELRQRVTDLLSVEAGRTHTVVEGSSYKRAERATLLTKEKVSINGKSIHLG